LTARGIILAAKGGPVVALRRYWRIYVTACQGASNTAIAEAGFHSVIGGVNICSGGAPSASTTTGIAVAARALDNDITTYWFSNGNVPQWWQYDFGPGRAADVVELTLSCAAAAPRNPTAFSLDWSDDGITWNTRKSFTTPANWTGGQTRVFS